MTDKTNPGPKPTMRTPNYQNVPQQMKDIPHWVNWKYIWSESQKRWTKLPLNPIGLKAAAADDPATWETFLSSCGNVWNNQDLGIGFEIGKKAAGHSSGLFCVDLDHVLKNGVIQDPAALDIFETLDSYTEISPGGDGLHIWIKADVTEDRAKRKGVIEMYGDGRYITVTGNLYGSRRTIEERTAEINELIDRYLTVPAVKAAANTEPSSSVATSKAATPDPWEALAQAATMPYEGWTGEPDTDTEILQKMEQQTPGAGRLFHGDTSNYDSNSQADQALCNFLAYWSNYDPGTVDRLFRQSELMRPKWDEIHDTANNRTYGQMTIDKALAGHTPRTPQAADEPNQGQAAASSSSVETSQTSTAGTPQQTQDPGTQPQDDVYLYSAAQARTDFEDMLLQQTPRISTGFPYLNMLLDGGLYPSLITLGAITSTGKTTLALQMMDNIAAAGTDVLIFSLEMHPFELMAKSISRLSFKLAVDKQDAVTTRQLLNTSDYKNYSEDRLLLIEKARKEYFETIAPHVFIRHSYGDMTVNKIRDILAAHEDQTGTIPIVLVDYVQLLAQPSDVRQRMDEKQTLDRNMMRLKQISATANIPVIAISSLNRQAYSTRGQKNQGAGPQDNRVTLTDFKESGAIEYTSDVLLGLNQISYDEKNKTGKMELDILKNRNGEKGTSQAFDYYYRYNCFIDRGTKTQKVI